MILIPNVQESSRETDNDRKTGPGRRRAKSAPDRGGHEAVEEEEEQEAKLPLSVPVSPMDRVDPHYPPAAVKVEADLDPLSSHVKDEVDPFQFDLDAIDHRPSSVKKEEEDSLDLDQLDNLQNLISTCDFSSVLDEEEAMEELMQSSRVSAPPPSSSQACPTSSLGAANSSRISPPPSSTTTLTNQTTGVERTSPVPNCSVPAVIKVNLSQEEMLSLMKLEMSYENSNASLPVMTSETTSLWRTVTESCNFELLNNGMTSRLVGEAVELCLKRNIIFLQENTDFTSLPLQTRKELYIQNMGSMCHVRGVIQRASFPQGVAASRFSISSSNTLQLQISFKVEKTGKSRLWNLTSSLDESLKSGLSVNLLEQVEGIWGLELERATYLILLVIVLFQCQSKQFSPVVDRFQNKYVALLYRYVDSHVFMWS